MNKKEIEKIIFLARIKDANTDDVSRILDYVEKMRSVSTEDVEPLFHFPEANNVIRKDLFVSSPLEVRKMMMSMGKDQGEFLKVESIL